jgi:hypothetical protein
MVVANMLLTDSYRRAGRIATATDGDAPGPARSIAADQPGPGRPPAAIGVFRIQASGGAVRPFRRPVVNITRSIGRSLNGDTSIAARRRTLD